MFGDWDWAEMRAMVSLDEAEEVLRSPGDAEIPLRTSDAANLIFCELSVSKWAK